MIFPKLARCLAISLLLATPFAHAEDIDLFTGVDAASSDLPNVLIVIDNTANWSTAFTAEMEALASTVAGLEENKFRLGFMMYTETGSGNGNPDGAYVRAAVRTMSAANKTLYENLVLSFGVNDDKSNNGKLGLTMSEVNRYFSGSTAYAGANKKKRDHTGNASGTAADNFVYALPGNALASSTATAYQAPTSSACKKNFVIFLSNGKATSNSSDNTTASNHLSSAGGSTTTIPLTPSGMQSEVADEWARYLANKTTNPVITYVIDVVPTVGGQYSDDYKALLESMAEEGKGKYFNVGSAGASDVGAKIKAALDQIVAEIQAVNSVFASASLPVSVNTQGTYLNQVFIGMFRPDGDTKPQWKGNLKQYKFKATVQGSGFALNLVDADDALAINNNTGFITQCARSFWTPTILDSYWNYTGSEAKGSCTAVANSTWSNTPDGEVVEKGAAGYKLRAISPASRTVKTCNTCAAGALDNFLDGNTAITATALGALTPTERTNIINWARGTDIKDENGNANVTEMRPSALGDVVHSRPVAVDYGGTTGVVVFYGANDGMLHAINGNQTASIGLMPAGGELWSFVAPDQYGRLKRIYDNSLLITFPSVGDATAKPYFFDGPITAYKEGTNTWIYATQRRGGRMIYAFDVSTPASPSLLWRKGCTTGLGDVTGCVTGFDGIGQTWSAVKNLKAAGYGSGTSPMVIVGGGYDTCEDTDDGTTNNSCTSPKGNRVYVMDAQTGTLLRTFGGGGADGNILRSVVGDITVVPNSTTGLAEYAYLTDTGGNVYRITFGTDAPANWTITQIASLGCGTPSDCVGGAPNRKFLFGPEVVVTPSFNAVLMGSGDREHPLNSNTATTGVNNAFFMVKDKPADAAWLSDESVACGGNFLCVDSLLAISNDGTPAAQADLDAKKGWYLTLSAKEQVVTSAVVVFGEVTFSTHIPTVPDVNACTTALGTAQVYNINYLDASAVGNAGSLYSQVSGGGLPPSPVAGMVTVINPVTGQPMTVPFIIGASPESPVEVKLKTSGSGVTGNKERVYWYIQK
jgi:type IV pilus assembly protein PilY1